MTDKAPSWPTLWRLGNSQAAKSTGVWLIVMPIIAKVMAEANTLSIPFVTTTSQHLALALPFRWKLLYASAVFIGAATLLYHLWCPVANKYENYSAFKAEGKVGRSIVGMLQVLLRDERGYRHLCHKGDVLTTFLRDYMGVNTTNLSVEQMWQALDDTPISTGNENEAFWYVWHFAERTTPVRRLIVSLLYVLGFGCLAVVFAQSILWVWRA